MELNLSEHAYKRTQNGKQRIFQLWSYPLMKELSWRTEISENHQWKLVINNPISIFTLSHLLTNASVDKQGDCYPELQIH